MKHRIIAAIIAVIMTAANVSAAPMKAQVQEIEPPKAEFTTIERIDFVEPETPTETPVPTVTPTAVPKTTPAVDPKATPTPEALQKPESESRTTYTFVATAYCPCAKCCGSYAYNRPLDENGEPIVYTATGTRATQGRTIAVDPRVIPYGTHVLVNGQEYVAEDCGGAIKGQHIDVYFSNHEDAAAFAVQTVTLEVLE